MRTTWISLTKKDDLLQKDDEWWLNTFNLAYETFHVLRVNAWNMKKVTKSIRELSTDDPLVRLTVLEILNYLFANYDYKLDEQQRKRYRLISKRIEKKLETLSATTNIVAEPAETIKENDNAMTCAQQAIAFYYLFDKLGYNFGNTKKSTMVRFIQKVTGKNYQNIRKRLDIDFNDIKTKEDLRIVAEAFEELMPGLTERVLNDVV